MKKLLAPRHHSGLASVGLLVLRVIAGVGMAFHGWGKIFSPFTWADDGPFGSIPGIMQACAAVAEFGGGIALAAGFVTPIAAIGIAATMAMAVFKHAIELGDPFVARGSSYESALLYFGIAVMFLLVGPGQISVDATVFGKSSKG